MTESEEAAAKAMAFELVLAKRALIKSWADWLFWKKRPAVSRAESNSLATERYEAEIMSRL